MADKFQLKAILTAVDKITPTTKQIGKSVRILHKSLRDVGNAGSELMRKIGVPAFLSFGAVTFGAIRATKAAMDYAGSIQDASDRTGASVEGYQALSNMLGLVGGSAEDAEMSFTKFNKGIAEAAAGTDKNFAGLMKKLGIPLKNAKGELVSLTDALPELAAGFEKNENPAVRTRIAMELFGKGGTKMIPILAKGREGVSAWIKEQERLGIIVSTQSVGALDDFGDSTAQVSTQLRALMTNSLAKVMPLLMPIVKQLTEWIAANKEFLQTQIVGAITDIANALKEVNWVEVFKGIKETVTDIKDFVKAIGGFKTLIYGMGLAWIAGPVAAIGSIIGALWRARLAFTALSISATASGTAVAGAFGVSTTAGIVASLGALARGAGLLGAAAFVGWTIGTVISDHLLSDEFKDRIGRGIARILSAFGNEEATQALINEGQMKAPVKTVPSYGQKNTGGLFTSNAEYAAMARNKSNIVGNQNKLNGNMTVKFENAPPGMRVESAKTNQSGFDFNADVGFRRIALGY
ncbi:MAG: hypothetical protein Q8M99_11875 [Methylotenera sp.]|nr:hypothetical protein [Methylotenera sp.]